MRRHGIARARLAKGTGAVVVPYAAGSTPDLLARMLSERLRVRLGKPVVVDEQGRRSRQHGHRRGGKGSPDGQTIGVSIAGPLGVNSAAVQEAAV